MPLPRAAMATLASLCVALVGCARSTLAAGPGASSRTHLWQEATGQPVHVVLAVGIAIPQAAFLVRTPARSADGELTYPEGRRPRISAHFRFTEYFNPDGSTVAAIYNTAERPLLCLKSDYLEMASEGVMRRAFKNCVELVER